MSSTRNVSTGLGVVFAITLVFSFRIAVPVNDHLRAADNEQSNITAVPDWAKTAVWYQIFPERFRNGDPSNDPQPRDLAGSWPHEVAPGWHISKWTADWYELQPWEHEDRRGFYYYHEQRRYGGDLQGVLDKLDYLKELGVTAIYFNPLFESPSLHKYDATMYHHIDNNFGPDPSGDRQTWLTENPADPATWKWTSADKLLLRLIAEAHTRNIKVVIDGVFNHVGMTFWAFEDVKKNQQRSLYKDWFTIRRWDDPATPQNEFEYEGWNGVRELPEVREDENGFLPGPRAYFHAVIKRWMDPNGDGDPHDGIDGWRLDVAEKVSPNFWKEFRNWVRDINPNAYIVGEVWWEDWQNDKMFNAAPWLQGNIFDAVMNYRWAREVMRFFAGSRTKISASEFGRRLQSLLKDYPEDHNQVLLNLLDSHDTDRLGSHIINSDLSFDKHVSAKDNPSYDVRKPNASEVVTQKLIALFQATYVGAPTIYYGDEAGMWGGDDPDCRKPMLWQEYTYDAEKSHPLNKQRPVDTNRFDSDLFQYYKTVIALRKKNPALSLGTFAPLVTDDSHDLFCYLRSWKNEHVVVALNNSWTVQDVEIPLPPNLGRVRWKAILDQRNSQNVPGVIRLRLQPKSGEVFGGDL